MEFDFENPSGQQAFQKEMARIFREDGPETIPLDDETEKGVNPQIQVLGNPSFEVTWDFIVEETIDLGMDPVEMYQLLDSPESNLDEVFIHFNPIIVHAAPKPSNQPLPYEKVVAYWDEALKINIAYFGDDFFLNIRLHPNG
jgi:hypothetical protein